MEKRLNRNYTRMLQVLNDKSWEDILRTTNLCEYAMPEFIDMTANTSVNHWRSKSELLW